MAVSSVVISSDAYMVCMTHALSNEKEEIMGLLIGDIDDDKVCHISAVVLLRRSDKQPDRVEISPEQLFTAATRAERLAVQCRRPMRIVGWYHSHPHITVWPSHVDLRTQASYQVMDQRFVGLIFSAFNQEKGSQHNKIQVICFQSINTNPEGDPPQLMRSEIPLYIAPSPAITAPCLDSLAELPKILGEEEAEAYHMTTKCPDMDLIALVHNGAVFTKSMCHIMEILSGPLTHTLEDRLQRNTEEISQLKHRKIELERQLQEKQRAEKSHKMSAV